MIRLACIAMIAFVAAGPARAELTLYSGGAVKSAMTEVGARYEQATKTKVAMEFHPMGPLVKKLAEGQTPDLVVLTAEAMADLNPAMTVGDTRTEIGRVGIGVAVNERAQAPDISTPEALKATLLAAKSIVYIDPERGTSGKHFATVLARLGIAEAVRAKATLGSGGYVVEPVGRGEIELGVHQITEILPVKGVKLVGPLPAPLQKETIYVGAVTAASRQSRQAREFLAFVRSPEMRALFRERGFIE